MLQFQEIIYLQQVDTNGIPSSKCKHCSHGCKPGGLQINGQGMMAYSDGLVLCEQMVGTTPSQLDLTQKQLLFSDGFRMFFQFRKLLSL